MRETASAALSSHDAVARFGPLFRAGRGQLIGNSGTVTSLTGVQMGLPRYQRSVVDGAWLARDEAQRTRDRLIEAGVAGRQAVPCLGPQRADLILPGCAILDAIWDLWPASRMRVGDRGLREGILLSMMHRGPPATAVRRGSPQMTGGVSQ
jgi:exopolyphosphatase/guanosine-5'-triphosphate,3'-diphosphate pyrophosphatase